MFAPPVTAEHLAHVVTDLTRADIDVTCALTGFADSTHPNGLIPVYIYNANSYDVTQRLTSGLLLPHAPTAATLAWAANHHRTLVFEDAAGQICITPSQRLYKNSGITIHRQDQIQCLVDTLANYHSFEVPIDGCAEVATNYQSLFTLWQQTDADHHPLGRPQQITPEQGDDFIKAWYFALSNLTGQKSLKTLVTGMLASATGLTDQFFALILQGVSSHTLTTTSGRYKSGHYAVNDGFVTNHYQLATNGVFFDNFAGSDLFTTSSQTANVEFTVSDQLANNLKTAKTRWNKEYSQSHGYGRGNSWSYV